MSDTTTDVIDVPGPEPTTDLAVAAPSGLPEDLGVAIPDLFPSALEMRDLAAVAVTLSHAALVPKALQGRPNDVYLVLLTARDLGVALTTALREFHPIDGKVTVSPKVKLAMVKEQGRDRGWHVWRCDPRNERCKAYACAPADPREEATWHAIRDGETHSSTVTMTDAANAQLTGKDNWKKYPQRMLSWRALGWLLDDVFPEVGTGLYQPDELGAITDEDGRPLDVIDVPAYSGMTGSDPEMPKADRDDLLARAKKLPETARADFAETWRTWRLPKIEAMRESHRKAGVALVEKFEEYAKAGKYAEAPVSAEEASSPPPAAPETEAEGGPTPPAPDASTVAAQEGEDPSPAPPGCDHPFTAWEQVGRCVYCTGCSARLYQGQLPSDDEGAKAMLAMIAATSAIPEQESAS